MMWSRSEVERLFPVLEQVTFELAPVDGKQILVLGSGSGEVAFWLAEMMETGSVTGLELDPETLAIAQRSTREMGLEGVVTFQAAGNQRIPLPDAAFDALVSESILYPSLQPVEISPSELQRVLKPGGRIVLIEMIVIQPLPAEVQDALESIGIDRFRQVTQAGMRSLMEQAGFVNIQLTDLSPTLRIAWEARRRMDRSAAHWLGYSALLEPGNYCLGKAIFYIYLRAERSKAANIG